MTSDGRITVGRAASELGLSPQAVRNLIRAGKLVANKAPNDRWRLDGRSVSSYLAAHGRKKQHDAVAADEIKRRLDDLTRSIDVLMDADRSSVRLLEALERERDRYRADAAAVRAAALGLVASAQDTQSAVAQLLEVLQRQGDALVQLLAPGSPQDLMP
jgi:hypothetical protein